MMKELIYLDYNATTPLAPTVSNAMRPYLTIGWGNPSSSHSFGIESKKAMDLSRSQVAQMLGGSSDEIIFTSGGSEANNFALKGIAFANKNRGNHIITSNFEHPAIVEVLKYLEKNGFIITYVPVDNQGIIDIEYLSKSITSSTILITVMHANNEVGTIQPIQQIVNIARKNKNNYIYVHTDASQSIGKIPVKVEELGVDLITVTPHKFYGPKGIGALYIKKGTIIERIIHGAGQESGLRAGTENIILAVGLGAACELVTQELEANAKHMKQTRDKLYLDLKRAIPGLKLNGHPELRLPNTLNLSFPIPSSIILSKLEGKVAASAGAACHSKSVHISAVLQAMNLSEREALGAIRFSTGKYLTMEDVDNAVNHILKIIRDNSTSNL